MKTSYHDHFRPANDVVFAVMYAKRILFCRLAAAVTGDVVELEGEPHSQATLRENDVLLNSIRFDTFAMAKNSKFYTIDMQRSYKGARQERRTIYYACRAISTQEVRDMEYEDLNPVNIAFILTEHNEKQAVRRIKLCDVETHEVYDDLIELTLVHVPAVLRDTNKKSELYIFARFFAISSQEEASAFASEYESNELGKELITMYNNAIANVSQLQKIETSPYFTQRLNEAQIEEIRQKAEKKGELIGQKKGELIGEKIGEKRGQKKGELIGEKRGQKKGELIGEKRGENQKAIRAAKKMLSRGLKPDVIADCLDLDLETIHSLQP